MATEQKPPMAKTANRVYVFTANCVNDHGAFVIGDKARGAFAPELVAGYLAAGILVERNDA
jgi:L-fucose isomerase-like protein